MPFKYFYKNIKQHIHGQLYESVGNIGKYRIETIGHLTSTKASLTGKISQLTADRNDLRNAFKAYTKGRKCAKGQENKRTDNRYIQSDKGVAKGNRLP